MESRMRIIAKDDTSTCLGKHCPTVYQDEDGAIYVQGFIVDDPTSKISDLPTGETLVRISESLLQQVRTKG
jgi:hypothetical protein